MSDPILLGELSGYDHVTLALSDFGGRPGPSTSYPCRSVTDLDAAIADFLERNDASSLAAAAFSATGWESDGGLAMPNHGYSVKRRWLQERLSIKRLHLVNDCVCKGMAIEKLRPEEQVLICGDDGDPLQTKLLLGISLGFGSVVILNDDLNRVTVLPCEGGHSDLPVQTDREFAVAMAIGRKHGHVSRERAVSLIGLPEIWLALHQLSGDNVREASPQAIVDMAQSGNATAREAVDILLGWLASSAADLALVTGARGGVYLSGDLIDLLGRELQRDSFSQRFHDKGRMSGFVKDIPVHVVKAREPELLGLSTLFV